MNRPFGRQDDGPVSISRRWLALVLILFAALGVLYSLATPIFEASDERWHYPVVKYIADGQGLPVQDPAVSTPWHQEGSQPPLYYMLAAGLTFWIDTGDFDEVQRPNPHAIVGMPQVVGNKNMFLHTERESWPWQGTTLAVHLIRLLSVGLGMVTVWLTWRVAGQLWPGDGRVWLLAAMLTAFNPMFLFISASVNNDNLAAPLAAGSALVLLRVLRRGQRLQDGLWLGILMGLGALTKLSVMALLPVAAAALTWDAWRRRSWRVGLLNGVVIMVGLALIAGWWYWRNWTLYGDPTGVSRMLDIAGRRDETLTLRGLWAEFEGFRISYWALFGGVSILADQWVYTILDGLILVAGVGILVAGGILAIKPDTPYFVLRTSYLLLIAWVGLALASLIRWTSQTYASQGRLMFVAIAGISAFLATGLVTLTPARWRGGVATVVGIGLLCLAAISPFRYIMPAYARPSLLTERDLPPDVQRLDWDVNGEMRLLGHRLERTEVHPAETLPVTVYWQALAPMAADYSVFVHLLGRNRSVVGQVNTYPGLGAWPTSRVGRGDVVADTYLVPIDPGAAAPTLLRVHIGLYRYDEPGRPGLPAFNAHGDPIEPWIATVKLTPWASPQLTPSNPLQVRFGESIFLVGYDLEEDLILYWQASGRPSADYTVFIQLWDETRQVAGFDGPPVGGDYPTGWWDAGEVIIDSHPLDLSGLPSGDYRLLIGLYRLETGERLAASGLDGNPLPGFAVEIPLTP